MKKRFNGIISVILSIVISISAIIIGAPLSYAEDDKGTKMPVIYVEGQGYLLHNIDENGEEYTSYPVSIPDGFIESAVKENIGVFAKAVLTQKWGEFGNVLSDLLYELYSPISLDENGEDPNGNFTPWTFEDEDFDLPVEDGRYTDFEHFDIHYDWRVDPFKTADYLHEYIEYVMEHTGAQEVAIVCRCYGCCVVAAYMEKYDCEYVSDVIFYASALHGATPISKLFAGDAYLDPDGIERFIYDTELSADEATNTLIQSFVSVFNDTYGLDLTCAAVNNVFPDIYLDILPQVLIDTYGTWPAYWAMVADEDYVKAKENVFHGADMNKYQSFVDIIDNYHYNIQVKANDILKKYADKGIGISVVAKYGFQTMPVTTGYDAISDGICRLDQASIGATTSSLDKIFSNKYIRKAKKNGTLKYISPDKYVDASTCLFPDRTWFISNIQHKDFPGSINSLFCAILNNENYTVNSSEKYPQYLLYENDSITPLTKKNCYTTERYSNHFFKVFKNIFKSIFTLIKNAIVSKFEK